MAKITKTYSVDQKIFEAFDNIAEEKNINKSSFIENCINKFVDDNNMGFVDKKYVLKTNSNYVVTIKRKDDTFYYLNDGSKIPIILFMQMYKETDKMESNEINSVNLGVPPKTGFEGYDKINS
jgi:hypothetical protein